MSKSKIKGCKLIEGWPCEETIRTVNSKLRKTKDINLPGTSTLASIQNNEKSTYWLKHSVSGVLLWHSSEHARLFKAK